MIRLEGWKHLWKSLSISSDPLIVVISERQLLPSSMICRHTLHIGQVLFTWNTVDRAKIFLSKHTILFSLLLLVKNFGNLPQLFREKRKPLGSVLLSGQLSKETLLLLIDCDMNSPFHLFLISSIKFWKDLLVKWLYLFAQSVALVLHFLTHAYKLLVQHFCKCCIILVRATLGCLKLFELFLQVKYGFSDLGLLILVLIKPVSYQYEIFSTWSLSELINFLFEIGNVSFH